MTSRFVLAVALTLSCILPSSPSISAETSDNQSSTTGAATAPEVSGDDEAAIRTQIATLGQAVAGADAKKMASLWVSDGTYVDDLGNAVHGRQELAERFATAMNVGGKHSVDLVPKSIKFIGPDVAWVEGTVTRKSESGAAIPETRFTMVLQKNGREWLIYSATETAIASQSSNHLEALSWMIGVWNAQRDGSNVKMTAEWGANRHFIKCQYEISKSDQHKQIENQVIGWDPRSQRIVSWYFDSSGGFGRGSWTPRGNRWTIESTGVDSSGNESRAITVLSVIDSNKFSWQSINRSIDGLAIADSQPLTVERTVK